MISDKLKKYFEKETEASKQKRAEESRPGDVAAAIGKLERATKSLENTVAQFNRKKVKNG